MIVLMIVQLGERLKESPISCVHQPNCSISHRHHKNFHPEPRMQAAAYLVKEVVPIAWITPSYSIKHQRHNFEIQPCNVLTIGSIGIVYILHDQIIYHPAVHQVPYFAAGEVSKSTLERCSSSPEHL